MAIKINGGSTNFASTFSASPTAERTVTVPDTSFTLAGTDSVQTYTVAQRGAVATLTDGATITPDFATSNNFVVTLGGNRTLANPSNLVAGQSGVIIINQDGTGSRTLAYGSNFDFGGATAPTLTTAANAQDMIAYIVVSSSRINCVFTGDLR
jgi:hypothetical protein